MLKKALFSVVVTSYFFGYSQTNIPVEKLLDSVEDYYTLDKENAFKLLAETKLDSTSEKNLDLVRYYELKAIVYANTEDKTAAFYSHLKTAISIAKDIKEHEKTGELYQALTINQIELDLLEMAESSAKTALNYFKKVNSKNGILYNWQLQSEILYKQQLYNQSIDLLFKHQTEFEKNEDKYLEINMHLLLSENYLELKKIDTALYYFNKLKKVDVSESSQDNTYYIETKNYYTSLLAYDIADEILEHKDSLNTKNRLFIEEWLAKPVFDDDIRLKEFYYKVSTDYYLKTNQLELHKTYNDSLITYIKSNAIEGAKYMEESTHQLLDMEDSMSKEISTKYKLLLLSGVLSVIALLSFWYYRKYVRHNKHLQIQNDQKSNTVEVLEESNAKLKANITGFKKYIEALKKETQQVAQLKDAANQKEKIKELHNKVRLDEHHLFNDEKNHLEVINELNTPFFVKLNGHYPKLSDTDKLICYFITMDFKNTDIATFLNLSERAIESKRYRIAKKMDLSKGTILKDFLQKEARILNPEQ